MRRPTSRRKSIGAGWWIGMSRGGPSFGRRGRRVSGSVSRRGPRGALRLAKGLSVIFRK